VAEAVVSATAVGGAATPTWRQLDIARYCVEPLNKVQLSVGAAKTE
jgi:hypothetical protein